MDDSLQVGDSLHVDDSLQVGDSLPVDDSLALWPTLLLGRGWGGKCYRPSLPFLTATDDQAARNGREVGGSSPSEALGPGFLAGIQAPSLTAGIPLTAKPTGPQGSGEDPVRATSEPASASGHRAGAE